MTDIEKMENTAVEEMEVKEEKAEKQPDEAVKTYSQTEVDNIVKARLSREKEKTRQYKAEIETLRQSDKASKVFSKILAKAGFEGTAEEQAKGLGEFYGMSKEEVTALNDDLESGDKSEKEAIAYINAKRFVEQSDAEDLEDEWERVVAIPESKRNLKDREMFNALKPKMLEKTIQRNIKNDEEWFLKNVGEGFEGFINSEEFNEFLDGTSMSVRTAMEKYVKLIGADNIKQKFSVKDSLPASTGSAKDSGNSKLKDYYSPEDYDKLTDDDLNDPEIFKRVRESMTKWK